MTTRESRRGGRRVPRKGELAPHRLSYSLVFYSTQPKCTVETVPLTRDLGTYTPPSRTASGGRRAGGWHASRLDRRLQLHADVGPHYPEPQLASQRHHLEPCHRPGILSAELEFKTSSLAVGTPELSSATPVPLEQESRLVLVGSCDVAARGSRLGASTFSYRVAAPRQRKGTITARSLHPKAQAWKAC
jgi:hypothetical protein